MVLQCIGLLGLFQYLLGQLFNFPLDASPNGGRMIAFFEIRCQHPFILEFDESAQSFHNRLAQAPAEDQLCPLSSLVFGRDSLLCVVIVEDFSLQHSLKSPLSKAKIFRKLPSAVIVKT